MTTLGDQIKAAREREHLSQRELGERLGVSKNTVSNWEAGMAPKSRLAALKDALPTFNPDLDAGQHSDTSDTPRRNVEDALRDASNIQLATELLRRLDANRPDIRPARLGADYRVPRTTVDTATQTDEPEARKA